MKTVSVICAPLIVTLIACAPRTDGATPATTVIEADDPAPGRGGDAAKASRSHASPGEPLARQDLPAAVREFLRERMERHGDSMESLLWASLNLQYGLIVQRSGWVAAETNIPRPPEGDEGDLVNRVLPGRFFDLQERVRRGAGELGRAAKRRDDEGIARAYGELVGTCIRCHGLYMRLPQADAGDR